jgi:uncharacterized protein
MMKRAVWVVLVLLMACARAPLAHPDTAAGRIYLWQASHPERPGRAYLLGSIHLERQDRPGLDRAITDAYARSQRLGVELDLQGDAMRDFTPAMWKYGMYPEGQTLEDALGSERMARVRQAYVAKGWDLPPRARPWLVYYALLLGGSEREGLSVGMGVDLLFTRWARGQKPIVSLETVDEQLASMASLPEPAQIRMLDGALDDLDAQQKSLHELVDAYRGGDDESLLAQSRKGTRDDPELAAYTTRLLDDRNRRMAATLDRWLAEPGGVFVVVGVLHLLGEQSVITELTRLGYRVERVPATGELVTIELPSEEIDTRKVIGHAIDVPGLQALTATQHAGVRMREAHAVVDGVTYVLMVAPVDASALALSAPVFFDAAESGITQQAAGSVDRRDDAQLQGFPSRRLEVRAQKPPATLRILMVRAGGQFYTLMAVTKPDSPTEARARIDEALASFDLITEP